MASDSTWVGAGADNKWTTGPNWLTGSAPPASADVVTGAMRRYLPYFDAAQSVNSLTIAGDYHEFDAASGATLTIGAGGLTSSGDRVVFNSPVNIILGAAQTWSIADVANDYGQVRVDGTITGAGLTKTGAGRLLLTGSNSLSGTFTLNQGYLRLGNDSALGTATLVVSDLGLGSYIESAGGDRTIANPIQINSALQLKTDGGGLKFSGPITLGASPVLTIYGPSPVTLSGAVGESGGSRSFTLEGSGTLIVQSVISTTGGATVNGGRLIFAPDAPLPSAGSLIVTDTGYVGTNLALGVQAGFIDRISKAASGGAIGFEGGALITEAMDLTGFSANARLGSGSTATLQGAITPQGLSYNFGGGGGLLTVNTSLPDGVGAPRSLSLNSPSGQSLSLVLNGSNAYAGGTSIQNSVLRFGNAEALPVSGTIAITTRGYLGFDYLQDLATLGSRVTMPVTNSDVIVGYDSSTTPLTISSAIDLTTFPANSSRKTYTYLGTSTDLTVTGSLTPAGGPTQPWRFAAVKGGHLTVGSTLSGTTGVVVNLPQGYFGDYDSSPGQFASPTSTVTLTGNNSYSGGTALQGGRLELGNANALGTGTLTASSSTLAVTTSGLTIANPIVNMSSGNEDGIHLEATDSAHSYTLSGSITGNGSLYKEGAGSVALTGGVDLQNNAGDFGTVYYSDVRVRQGTLDIGSTFTVGGQLDLYDGTTVNLASNVSATVGELVTDKSPGGSGTINLGAGSVLTIDSVGQDTNPYFSGVINGSGSIVKTGIGDQLLGTLPGPSTGTYSGTTTIMGGGLFAMSNGALGSGPIIVNATISTEGGLGVYTGVTLTNSLTFTSGVLAGYGTLAPSTGPITVGASRLIWPGNLFSTDPIGTLTFGTGLTLASGGTYTWEISDATGIAGVNWDQVLVTGSLTFTSTEAAPFYLQIYSLGDGLPGFNDTQPYSWVIASASGVSGFDANAVSLSSAGITLGEGHFFLTQSGNDVLLNFDPVPEPSALALLGLGIAGLLVARIRRRR